MFKRIKKWFNDPINEDDMFGVNLRKLYQFFRDAKKNFINDRDITTRVDEDKIKEHVENFLRTQHQTIPRPYNDDSFLFASSMEIVSKIVWLKANQYLFSNTDLYIEQYEKLRICLDEITETIKTLNPNGIITREIKDDISKELNKFETIPIKDLMDNGAPFDESINNTCGHWPSHVINSGVAGEDMTLDGSVKPPVFPDGSIPDLKLGDDSPKCEVISGHLAIKYDEEKRESTPTIPAPFTVTPIKNVEEDKVKTDVAKYDIPPHKDIPHDFVPLENMVSSRVVTDQSEEQIIPTDDHSHDTLGARELKNLSDSDDDEVIEPAEDHSHSTLDARELTNLSSEDEEEEISLNQHVEETSKKILDDLNKTKDVFNRLAKITSQLLNCGLDQIKLESNFIVDLGCDSLDTVELIMACEEEFGIEIPDDGALNIETVADAVQYLMTKV